MALELDAIVLADAPLARVRIAGLPAYERAARVARRVGATRVVIVDAQRDELAAWRGDRSCPLLVIRADQLVHTPLVAPLIAALPTEGVAVAVGPTGAYAGAYVAAGSAARHAIAALTSGENTAAFTGAADAARIPHGEIARHSIATPADRAAAHKLLYRILIKPQDNAITRYLYRPVSLPLTKLLVRTPITPNQVSFLVALMVAVGCWLTAHASMNMVIAGTVMILVASYVDCCDGEIARLKLMSSRFGAWFDTIVDELSSVGYMVALGIHCHLYFGHPGFDIWIAGILVGIVTYGCTIYGVYYNIIVAVGSANSQDYVGRFDLVPGSTPSSVRLQPAAATAIAPTKPLPPWLQWCATYLPYVVRRDFISWGAVVLAVFHLTHVSFVVQVAGGVVSAIIVMGDHVRLRKLRRSVLASGRVLEAPAA